MGLTYSPCVQGVQDGVMSDMRVSHIATSAHSQVYIAGLIIPTDDSANMSVSVNATAHTAIT